MYVHSASISENKLKWGPGRRGNTKGREGRSPPPHQQRYYFWYPVVQVMQIDICNTQPTVTVISGQSKLCNAPCFMLQSFQRQSNILFRILSSVSSHNASPHLSQLLLRLDFNKYYTTAGGQLGR